MRYKFHHLVFCLLMATQTACTHMSSWSTLPSWYLPPASASSLLRYYRTLGELSAEAEYRELRHAREAFAVRPALVNRLRLALLLSRPESRFYDPTTALDILRVAKKPPQPSSLEDLRYLLEALNAQQVQQAEILQQEATETIERLRERVDYLSQREAKAQRQLSEEQERGATLLRQLDELREIEQTLGDRRKAILLQLTKPDE